MAKRKRLGPAAITSHPDGPLETKAFTGGWHVGSRPPIADVTRDTALQSALDDVTEELRDARATGRMVVQIPLEDVETFHLVRDRVVFDSDDMDELIDSLRARGQQTPIEVMVLDDGGYGLISGWRRLTALQKLHAETEDDQFATIAALVRQPKNAAKAYLAMVEENEIRSDLSFYERARIAVKASQAGVFKSPSKAVQKLFAAARAPKRSKIVAFTYLVEALDDDLRFPTAIPEKLGLAMVKALQSSKSFKTDLRAALAKSPPATAADERAVIEAVMRRSTETTPAAPASVVETVAPGVEMRIGKGRLTLSGPGVTEDLQVKVRAWLEKSLS